MFGYGPHMTFSGVMYRYYVVVHQYLHVSLSKTWKYSTKSLLLGAIYQLLLWFLAELQFTNG